jgi:hypothetical protein
MGRESTSYWLALGADAYDAFARTLERSEAELLGEETHRVDYCLRDPNRYWIDIRLHRRPGLRVEIRIALTNDTWAIREPLQRALTPLPEQADGEPLLDEAGDVVAITGEERWWYDLEEDYGHRRDDFVAAVGDFFAPIAADQVYTFLHHARKRRNMQQDAAEKREMEVELLHQLWEISPPAGEEDDALA